MLENFASYTETNGGDYNRVLKDLEEIQHYKPQARPKYCSMMIRFSLLPKYTSC